MRIFARFAPSCAYANAGGRKRAGRGLTDVKKLKAKCLNEQGLFEYVVQAREICPVRSDDFGTLP